MIERTADYTIAKVDRNTRIVWLRDLDGAVSMTNDAERIVASMHNAYPDFRVIYCDTDGNWDEMTHAAGVFKGFAPARHLVMPS